MKYIAHLKKDKKMGQVMKVTKPYVPKKEKDLYSILLRSIAGQQLSVKAAATIWERFLNLFPKKYPEAKLLVKMSDEKLRSAGFSYQKAGYLKNIAAFSMKNKLDHATLSKMNDAEVIVYLTQIKGVGKWTVEMLLMFALERPDVFPSGDLGILNGMKKIYKLTEEGKALRIKCEQIALKWEPYRSHACFYIWPYKDSV
ncbi:MAG TPA: DNA-3-methyladenine glycosylase 2 family protein [Flavobacteriales bacterium]|nr:DNA-3-methyladenine glycosylase 2 family protein [Flavobacteriales bacterium]